MTTAAQLVKAILQEDIVQASEAPIASDEAQDTIFALNNFMFELAADGVNLGFTEVLDLGDEITVVRGAINGIIKNVSMQIAQQFSVPITPVHAAQAANGLRIMTKLAVTIPAAVFPDTLPIGSGNECGVNQHFYGEPDDTLLTEQGLVIIPEANTELP